MKIAIPEQVRGVLEARLPADVEPAWYETVEEVKTAARGVDVLLMGFIEEDEIRTAVESANGARWISTSAGGADRYPMALIRDQGMVLTKGSGVGAPAIAEYVILCLLVASKNFGFYLESSARGEWPRDRPPGAELEGTNALVVGYGGIGRTLGTKLKGLGVNVTGVRRTPTEEPGIISDDSWKDRLGEYDWVALTAALTGNTRHVLGKPEFDQMKPTAWLVNIARGGLVDQDALVEALKAGRPRGAFLDVTEPEPLPSDHPLWWTPNVVITGHSSGRGSKSSQRYANIFLDNLERFKAGRPLTNQVDLAAGY
jgi:phosphoglycerate dehydrogenase-like enzyme